MAEKINEEDIEYNKAKHRINQRIYKLEHKDETNSRKLFIVPFVIFIVLTLLDPDMFEFLLCFFFGLIIGAIIWGGITEKNAIEKTHTERDIEALKLLREIKRLTKKSGEEDRWSDISGVGYYCD